MNLAEGSDRYMIATLEVGHAPAHLSRMEVMTTQVQSKTRDSSILLTRFRS